VCSRAPTSPSRRDVSCKCGTAQCDCETKLMEIFDNEARPVKPLEQEKMKREK